ncbi:MAG: Crp/Fnr family transcriptional regulator [Solirubrobacteraceae bacterium]
MSHLLSRDDTLTTGNARSRPGPADAANATAEFLIRSADRAPSATNGSPTTSGPPHAGHATRRLLHDDPELATAIPAAERAQAIHALRVHVRHLAPGRVDLGELDLPQSTFALLITRGAMTRHVFVGDRAMTEMLIEGDVLSPDSPSPATPESSHGLVVLHDARLAVLDRRFVLAAAHWPGLMRAVMSRLADQQHRLAVHGAICQLPRVEQRIEAILSHLASRTGIVTPHGVLLRQPLSHRAIADLIGARRPTVSLAIAALQGQGRLCRRADGDWLLPHYHRPLPDLSPPPAGTTASAGS